MKYDASRDTYARVKHYRRVLMQQGRVQVDADWNEQSDIIAHRAETEASDVIGPCGGPLHNAAFHIVGDVRQLTAEEAANPANQIVPPRFAAPDFLISAGRYYVDGILCENERLTAYTRQPDLPRGTALSTAGLYVVYLDVWQRHLTALDDSSIRETALGGPDTATRAKTVWQVKWIDTGNVDATGNCLTQFADYDRATAAPTGTLAAREALEAGSTNPCIVPPGAGYGGLENQLYRVEVHAGGTALDVVSAGAPVAVTRVSNASNQIRFPSGTWESGQSIEIVSLQSGTDPLDGTLAQITAVDGRSKTLTLNLNVSSITFDTLGIRPVSATYKWSRDNGVPVTAIENISGQEVTVHDLGPDAVLGFAEGQWVEILDDERELKGLPGQLAQIVKIDRAINLITLNTAPAPLVTRDGVPDTSGHPKLRRWDGVGAIKISSSVPADDYFDLEDGVQIRFGAGTFRTGDYWTIPARTATADAQAGNIEWPDDGVGNALAQLPFGIEHHYCRLAVLRWTGTTFDRIEDCRSLFPPVTELTSLFYVSGDGQESMPGNPIPQLLQVGVFNGRWPVAGARVRFVAQGLGRVAVNIGAALTASTSNVLEVVTGADGIASCAWRLEVDVTKPSQQVEARLLDANAVPLPAVVRFNGNLSIADQVFYDPGSCDSLRARTTVQKAIDQLSRLVRLHEVSGNNQEVMPGAALEPLRVLAANDCGPVKGQKVQFRVVTGTGTLTLTETTTDGNGMAATGWKLDEKTIRQEVEAALVDTTPPSIAVPTKVRFTANLSVASQVAYDASKCPDLAAAGVKTVEEALNELCKGQDDAAITIENVLATVDRKPLENDTTVNVSRLAKGITIVCSHALAKASFASSNPDGTAAKPTCYVTLDLPYPIGADADFWRNDNEVVGIVGFQPLILDGFATVEGKEIFWILKDTSNTWLQKTLFSRLVKIHRAPLLAHLTLKGKFIVSRETSPLLHVDGDAFGTEDDGRITLSLPSGDGRKGGDFEMWFWLVGETRFVPEITLDAGQVERGIRGSVRDVTGSPLPSIPVTATLLARIPVPFTTKTDAAGNFFIAQVAGSGRYEVRVDVGGQVATKIVDVTIIA